MSLIRLVSSLVLLSLFVVISSANPNYDSNTKNPDSSSFSHLEHGQYYKDQYGHNLHYFELFDELGQGDKYDLKKGNKLEILQENPEYQIPIYKKSEVQEYIPNYGLEKKT